jgi:hypothetical protein
MDTTDQEDGVLLLISTPGGKLTYEDHDVVQCMEASTNPGRAVVANEGGHWTFVYITDKKCMDTMDLMQSRTSGVGEDEEYIAKRLYGCVLDAARAEICKTYRTYDEAPEEQKMTWATFETSYRVSKDD